VADNEVIPEQVPVNDPRDDTNTVETNILYLFNTILAPIAFKRSKSSPAAIEEVPKQKGQCGTVLADRLAIAGFSPEPQESLAHTFYRMIGLPIIGRDGNFYNPGFDPTRNVKTAEAQISISQNIDQTLRDMARLRENAARERLSIFKKRGLNAAIYGMVMGKVPMPFQNMDANKEFNELDKQIFTLPSRKSFIENNFEAADPEKEITNFFASGNHMLKPFVCDPMISDTVMPGSSLFAAPFLKDKTDQYWDNDIYLDRPILEQVLRQRIEQRNLIGVLERVTGLVGGSEFLANLQGLSIDQQRNVVSALLAKKEIDPDLIPELLKSNSGFELSKVTETIQALKGIITRLVAAVQEIAAVNKTLIWTPLATTLGPVGGVAELSKLVRTKVQIAELTRQIEAMRLANVAADFQIPTSLNEIGPFALLVADQIRKTFNADLHALTQKELECVRKGSDALRDIEIITGEISGFGLVDYFAIMATLWSLDLNVVISLLDESSFARLYSNNIELINPEVQARKSAKKPVVEIKEAITQFQNRVVNILAFCDGLKADALGLKKPQQS